MDDNVYDVTEGRMMMAAAKAVGEGEEEGEGEGEGGGGSDALSWRQHSVINNIDQAFTLTRRLAAIALPQAHLLRARCAAASAGFQVSQRISEREPNAREAALGRRQRPADGRGEIDRKASAWPRG